MSQEGLGSARPQKHAVVIGGSLAGLLTARVLSDRFEQVTLIERDRYKAADGDAKEPRAFSAVSRKGLPQSPHVHVLLLKGAAILEELFPGFDAELGEGGATTLQPGRSFSYLFRTGPSLNMTTGIDLRACSRALIDEVVQRRVFSNPRVRLFENVEVTGLLRSGHPAVVTGVALRRRPGAVDGVPDSLPADLVVDASGRRSHAPAWLEELGYGRPNVHVVNSYLGYATRWYKRTTDAKDFAGLVVFARPPKLGRGGIMLAIEESRWVISIGGIGRDYPPTDDEGFAEYAKSLPTPVLYDHIRSLEPISPVMGYRDTDNRWVRFDELRRWPEGFLVMGDAVAAFNPLYGQGMTVAAMEAQALSAHLRRSAGGAPFSPLAFQRALKEVLMVPWMMATTEDYRWPLTEGHRPHPALKLLRWYGDRLAETVVSDPELFVTFLKAQNLVIPPHSMFAPKVATRVLRKALSGWRASLGG